MDYPQLHRKYDWMPSREVKPPAPRTPIPIHTMAPRSAGLYFRPFNAYRLEDGRLLKTTIWEKPNQNFWAYATAFEKAWSKLADIRNAFDPVVDSEASIIGHVGRVDGGSIVVPQGQQELGANVIAQQLSAGIPFFVAENPPDASWARYFPKKSGEGAAFTVVTSIDGRVLTVADIRHTGAGAIAEDFSPLDVVFIIKGVIDLGIGVGRIVVRGLASKRAAAAMSGAAKVIIFSGPSKELALEAGRGAAQALKRTTVYVRETGMTAQHFAAFQAAAKETKLIAVVRNTNPASLKLIEKGCPGKPMFFKFHTSESTGVVMARTSEDVAAAWAREYFVVGADGVARREVMRNGKRVVETWNPKDAFWKVEEGQVIDPIVRKPLVGDYDLMGVIDPTAPGRNVALVASEGQAVSDVTSPAVKQFMSKVNPKMDRNRVLHGAQDQFAGYRGGATAFHPDGTVTFMPDEAAVKRFYETIGRETRAGHYAQPPGAAPAIDELAARRARK